MSKTGIEIIGIQNVHRVLEQLPKRINRKLLNQAMGMALNIFIKEVRSRANAYSRKLGRAKNFGKLPKKEQPWGRKLRVPYQIAGARKRKGSIGYLFGILEYGAHKTPVIKAKKGKILTFLNKSGERIFTRKMKGIKAHPILRPAADRTRGKVSREFMKILQKKTKEYLNKMIKKYY